MKKTAVKIGIVLAIFVALFLWVTAEPLVKPLDETGIAKPIDDDGKETNYTLDYSNVPEGNSGTVYYSEGDISEEELNNYLNGFSETTDELNTIYRNDDI